MIGGAQIVQIWAASVLIESNPHPRMIGLRLKFCDFDRMSRVRVGVPAVYLADSACWSAGALT
jgi:hypothetical protein